MYGMTPEERFSTIENLLASLTEAQVRNDGALEKMNASSRDLVVVSRTLVDAQMKTTAQIEAVTSDISRLSQAQKDSHDEMREKLHALIDIVDRLLRGRKK
jgi:hypothetical protein